MGSNSEVVDGRVVSRAVIRVPWLRVHMRWVLRRGPLQLIAVLLSLFFLLPFLWLVSGSLKTNPQIFAMPPIWIPHPLQWKNYPQAFVHISFLLYVRNTLVIGLTALVGSLVSNTLVAYGFARIRWPGRDVIFLVVLATLMLPYAATMVPLFIVFKRIGWIGTYLPLIVPSFFGNAFFIFMLRQFFLTIPFELSEAALIDGANELGILTRIILPLSRPALGIVALFQFMHAWGDYLGPLIYLRRTEEYTIALGLTLFLNQYRQEWALLMAASTMALSPIVLLFFFTQRTFIEGITLTGLKG